MKKVLKLQDHKHTAKRLEHAHTSYRALALVMLFFGILFFFVQRTVNADSYVVSAKVPAPIPTIAAEIITPTDLTTTTSRNIVISGTCPIIVPAIVVELFRNNDFIGSAGCSIDGEFSGTFNLIDGQNVFVPKISTITNDPGPVGTAKTITYLPATSSPPTIPPKPNVPQPSSAESLQIKTEAPFLVFKQNESFVWTVDIQGGVSPYTILVDWGDGTKSTYAANSSGAQKLDHIFKKNKNTIVRISVKDATGQEVYTSVAGVTFQQTTAPIVSGASANALSSPIPLAALWAVYGVAVIATVGFWVGAQSLHHGAQFKGKTKKPTLKKR